jgi:hypothetical protein
MRTLEITSYIGCPVGCAYCPQGLLRKSYEGLRSMTLENFIHILSNVPKDVRIDFSGFSEIFYNSFGAQMIWYAFDRGYKVVLYTTLSNFSKSDVQFLKGVQFTDLCFHLYPHADAAEFAKKKELFERKICQGRTAVITDQWKWSRAGNVWDRPEQLGTFHCLFAEKKFDHNVVLPNGNVYLCCQDYGLKHCIGNLYDTHFDNLNREDYTMLSNEQDSDIICRKCELMQPE